MNAIDRLLEGTVDLHVHPAPSLFPRLLDEVEAVKNAAEVGMRAIVVKSHHHSTASDAWLLKKYVLGGSKTQLFGSVVLNSYQGGINPYVVDMTIRYGGRVVWFPTFSSGRHIAFHTARFPDQQKGALPEYAIPVLDDKGDLVSDARKVLELVAEADILVSPGHASPHEIAVILEGAREAGVRRMIVNHPNLIIKASEAEVLRYVELGAYIEHSLGMYVKNFPLEDLLRLIELVGPEKTVFGSDLGQVGMPYPLEAYRNVVPRLLDHGMRESDLEVMMKKNPAWLLQLDE